MDPRLPFLSCEISKRLVEVGDEAKMNLECDGHKLCIYTKVILFASYMTTHVHLHVQLY